MSTGNGRGQLPVDIIDLQYPQFVEMVAPPPPKRPIWTALVLFFLTVLTTLAVGAQLAITYANDQEPFANVENPFTMILGPLKHPNLLLLGIPFSFTLLGILFAHEMGHYIACKLYGIDVELSVFPSGAKSVRHIWRVHSHSLSVHHKARAV